MQQEVLGKLLFEYFQSLILPNQTNKACEPFLNVNAVAFWTCLMAKRDCFKLVKKSDVIIPRLRFKFTILVTVFKAYLSGRAYEEEIGQCHIANNGMRWTIFFLNPLFLGAIENSEWDDGKMVSEGREKSFFFLFTSFNYTLVYQYCLVRNRK